MPHSPATTFTDPNENLINLLQLLHNLLLLHNNNIFHFIVATSNVTSPIKYHTIFASQPSSSIKYSALNNPQISVFKMCRMIIYNMHPTSSGLEHDITAFFLCHHDKVKYICGGPPPHSRRWTNHLQYYCPEDNFKHEDRPKAGDAVAGPLKINPLKAEYVQMST